MRRSVCSTLKGAHASLSRRSPRSASTDHDDGPCLAGTIHCMSRQRSASKRALRCSAAAMLPGHEGIRRGARAPRAAAVEAARRRREAPRTMFAVELPESICATVLLFVGGQRELGALSVVSKAWATAAASSSAGRRFTTRGTVEVAAPKVLVRRQTYAWPPAQVVLGKHHRWKRDCIGASTCRSGGRG